jgi:hypothetical protein
MAIGADNTPVVAQARRGHGLDHASVAAVRKPAAQALGGVGGGWPRPLATLEGDSR